CIGVVEEEKIVDGSRMQVGDQVIALASNGLHTNGYTLVRKLMDKNPGLKDEKVDGKTFFEQIMLPHMCYYQATKKLCQDLQLHGMAHITGGGVQGNLVRILPQGKRAIIDLSSLKVLPIFTHIQKVGNVPA